MGPFFRCTSCKFYMHWCALISEMQAFEPTADNKPDGPCPLSPLHVMISGCVSMTESCLCLMQCCPRTWRSRGSIIDFHPYFPQRDSPNLFHVFCTVDDGIFKVFTILNWGTLLLICPTICHNLSRVLNLCPSSLQRNSASLRCSF